MELFNNIIMPFTVTFIILYGLIRKVPVFDVFIEGSKKAVGQIVGLLPCLTALCLIVSSLSSSGAIGLISQALSPVGKLVGIPEEVLPLCIISPLSGSGSIAVLEEIFAEFSPDSYIGRTASVIAGASETTFYAIAVYYGSTGIKKIRHTLPAALTADITTFIAAALFCKIL